jgi:serine-type D-Ala-D-Ala carboxypeptidase
MRDPFDRASAILLEGIRDGAFPAAATEVGRAEGTSWRRAFGSLTYAADSTQTSHETIFDLASLTKVIATTTLAMRAIDDGLLALDDQVMSHVADWRGADRADVTIGDLLAHASGLPAYLPFFRDYTGRTEFQPAICQTPLEYAPRSQSIYSDLGFMLLGFILEDLRRNTRAGVGRFDPLATLTGQFRRIAAFITIEPLAYTPPRTWRPRTAPTEHDDWRGRTLQGEVHDENAWALGGAAGHAGLFGTAGAVGAFAQSVLRTIAGDRVLASPQTFRDFIRRTPIPGSSRALGWDTMLPTSSCGTRMSSTAIGHTGFTGTSLWIDWERDIYVVLLTNRVHPTRESNRLRAIRPAFHDAVMEELERT